MEKKIVEFSLFAVVFLFGIYLWTLPISDMPFGDVDSSVHFTSGDYMARIDRSVYKIPYYLNYTIGKDTGGYFAYPPQFNTGEAISQIIGGERIIPIFIFIAILCLSLVLSSFLLMRTLYGFIPALSTAFLLVFSRRDIMYYLWGLWPQTIAFCFVPLVIYCYYRFLDCHSNGTKKYMVYLYMTVLFIAIQYTFHQQAFFFSMALLFVYTSILIIMNRKLPFKIKDVALAFFILIMLLMVFAPFQIKYTLGMAGLSDKSLFVGTENYFGFKTENIGRLFHWFKVEEHYFGSVPKDYFLYTYVYGGYWTLPLLLIGLIFIFLRRKKQDILLISWLITIYLFIHMEIVGGDRNFRFLQLEAQLFCAIISVGLISLISVLRLPQKQKTVIKYTLIILFFAAAIYFNARPVYSELPNAYQGIARITRPEYEATLWMSNNLPEDARFLLVGTVAYNKKKWIPMLSYRFTYYDENLIPSFSDAEQYFTPNHILLDYSDLLMINRQDIAQQLETWEKEALANATLLYDKNYVTVYKLGN